ncbi:hypothetical protein BGW39_008639 [Mortierella sp. 14UC]|nr:hypothetical protein BGW39_008639 [Mortierella sp. 14UC]
MHQQIDLPPETLHLIFSHLSPKDLYPCLFVSRSWSGVAEAHLYSDITLNMRKLNTIKFALALKTRKHLLRRFELQPDQQFPIPELLLLDIFLDYRQEEHVNDGDGKSLPIPGYSNNHRFATVTGLEVDDTQTRPAFPESAIGPNRPSLTHFSVVGHHDSGWILDSILYTLKTLTNLKIHFYFSGTFKMYTVDMDRILETLPHLRHLSIDGHRHRYKVATELKDDSPSSSSSGITTTSAMDTLAGSWKQHGLESFTFEPTRLMSLKGPDAFTFFRRLGNMRRIQVNAAIPYLNGRQNGRPWALGQALRRYCPNLEVIETNGPVPLWFFDLAIVPHDRIQHITTMAEESMPLHWLDQLGELAPGMNQILRLARLQEQEAAELLACKFAEPYFPQLKTLILKGDHCLSVQDLLSLAVQAPFLKRFEIQQWPVANEFISEMYDKDAAAAATTAAGSNIHSTTAESNALVESRRLRKREIFGEGDLAAFLQSCASLCQFSVAGHNIPFISILQEEFIIPTLAPGGTGMAATETIAGKARCIRPWACEESLETLRFGFEVSAEHPDDHGLVWKHLGRFRKLRYLHLDLSTLLPLPEYGVENLLEGGISETLEEIRSLPGWWKAKDRRELVLWFARSFPKLRVLGLAYNKWHVDRGEIYCAFLDDGEVKRCSIPRVFVEDAPEKEATW